MPFTYERVIHFADTDAAGVVFFPKYLSICHEAYEEALAEGGMPIRDFFSGQSLMVPVSKSSADYLRPLFCGDRIRVTVKPALLNNDTYAIDFEIFRVGTSGIKLAATVRTAHVCIDAQTRERVTIPAQLRTWVNAG